jgi:glycerol kinase
MPAVIRSAANPQTMAYLLALDQGTTSSRAIVFDGGGKVVAIAQREFRQYFPQPGWVEHDANEIWQSQIEVAISALVKAGIPASELAAVGITNQRETTVLWDRASGEPIAPAIVWQDRRTAAECEVLRQRGVEPVVSAKTGLLLDPYFSGTKLAWLLDHIPGARLRAARGELAFGTMDSWLAWKLTDGRCHVTDASNASRTLLYDIHRGAWDDELLGLLNVPREVLPQVCASSGVIGEVAAHWMGAAIPLAGIAGDQQAATFGNACLRPGMAKNTYGTGCFMLLNTGNTAVTSKHRLLTTVAWQLQQTTYALEGSVFMAGAIVQWLRDGLGIIRHASEIEALAASVPDSEGVVLVPAFAGLGAPWWNADARATLSGMSRGTVKAHIARAALDAIVCQSADVLHAMQQDSGVALAELRVDGGAASNDMLMQLQADMLGVPVLRPQVTETTALGAAYLAGLAVGVWQSVDDIAAHWQLERRFEPRWSDTRRQEQLDAWHNAIGHTLAWRSGV